MSPESDDTKYMTIRLHLREKSVENPGESNPIFPVPNKKSRDHRATKKKSASKYDLETTILLMKM